MLHRDHSLPAEYHIKILSNSTAAARPRQDGIFIKIKNPLRRFPAQSAEIAEFAKLFLAIRLPAWYGRFEPALSGGFFGFYKQMGPGSRLTPFFTSCPRPSGPSARYTAADSWRGGCGGSSLDGRPPARRSPSPWCGCTPQSGSRLHKGQTPGRSPAGAPSAPGPAPGYQRTQSPGCR